MDTGYFFFAFVLFLVYEYVRYLIQRNQKQKQARLLLGDGCMPDEMVIVRWKEFQLPMRYIEKIERWDFYTDQQKRKLGRMLRADVQSNKINPDRLGRGHNLTVINDGN